MNYYQYSTPFAATPNGTFDLKLGAVFATIIGGPYAYAAAHPTVADVRVKLAPEVKGECEVLLPIRDFSIPNEDQAYNAVHTVLMELMEGSSLYVGCMGGFGRTGLFLALLVKAAQEYEILYGRNADWAHEDPVEFVRSRYVKRAVETVEQEDFVAAFNPRAAVQIIRSMQPVPLSRWVRIRAIFRDLARRASAVFSRA